MRSRLASPFVVLLVVAACGSEDDAILFGAAGGASPGGASAAGRGGSSGSGAMAGNGLGAGAAGKGSGPGMGTKGGAAGTAGKPAKGGGGGDAGSAGESGDAGASGEGGDAGAAGAAGDAGASGEGGDAGSPGGAGFGGAEAAGTGGKSGASGVGGAAGEAGGAAAGGAAGKAGGAGSSVGGSGGQGGGTAGAGGASPCADVTCETPPKNVCLDGSQLATFPTKGTCQDGICSYVPATVTCTNGCKNDACAGDPCAGVTCQTPPAPVCANATTRRTFAASGTCTDGACTYAESLATCPKGCVDGACRVCAVDTDCGAGKVCTPAGACAAAGGCATPTEACIDGTQTRDGCGNARVIGRKQAGTPAGITIEGSTCEAQNRSDEANVPNCFDAGNDHHYRVYLRKGETIQVSLASGVGCVTGGSFDITLKLYQGDGCQDGVATPFSKCGTRAFCRDQIQATFSTKHVAPVDGWLVIVADGSTIFDDDGAYKLGVKLTCATGDCECL